MWNDLQKGWTPPKIVSKELYNNVKTHKEDYRESLVAVVGFCASYNAKWFGGYAGIVNTKINTTRNYYDESIRNIEKQMQYLKDVEFTYKDYNEYKDIEGCLIYCDIPYQNTTKYTNGNNFDYEDFWNWARVVSQKNIVLISEYNAPNDFKCIFKKELTTTLDKNSRRKGVEKLFIHKSLR